MKELNDDEREELRTFEATVQAAEGELRKIIPRIAEARRLFMTDPSDEGAKQALVAIEEEGAVVLERHDKALKRMMELVELTDDELDAYEAATRVGDASPRYRRETLTAEQVPTTDFDVDMLLAGSLDKLLNLIPASTLRQFGELPPLSLPGPDSDGLLSVVKGVRPESEYPTIHRLAQGIQVCKALLARSPTYDMFAGASLVPQIARLGDRLDLLAGIPGAKKRIRSLWQGPSAEVDSTLFELLVGAGCANMGGSVEFLDPERGKTPDLRCHDPYPLVVECKRKRVLTEYEISEERVMRALFVRLDASARKSGIWGTFRLHLTVDSQAAPIDEIVANLLRMRFAGGNGLEVVHPWGKIALVESPRLASLGGLTRPFSPVMLEQVFGWNSDLAEWDGMVCRIRNFQEPAIDLAQEPIGLLWSNSSEQAVKKRSWGPMTAMKEAIEQIPPGEFGVPYVAYQEGARREIADMRTFNFSDWMKESSHPASIRVPLARIIRFYPRPLNHGAPDFIESTVSFVPDYADDALPKMLPSTVVVR